ncbi:MAG: hypothetical protein GX496_00790 [Firmicutes bacterium]|nr:hypothetical protein [Bacillota bacterium]
MRSAAQPARDRRGWETMKGRIGWGRLAVAALLGMAFVHAAALPGSAAFSFSLTPLLVELEGRPGTTQSFDISLGYESDGPPADFVVSVVPIRQDASGAYRPDPDGRASAPSAAEWIEVQPTQFTITPGRSQTIQGRLTFPRSFSGGAYAAVIIELVPEPPTDGEPGPRQEFRHQFAVIVEAVSRGAVVRPQVRIDGFRVATTEQRGFEQYRARYGPQAVVFLTDVVNEGNVHALVSGTLSLWDESGRKIREFPLGAGRGAVLPGAAVAVGSLLPGGLPPGRYTAQAVINYGGLRPAITRQSFVLGGDLLDSPQGGRAVRIDVQPEVAIFELVPGASRFAAIRVRNLDRVPVTLSGTILPLVYDEAGNPNTEALPSPVSNDGWLTLRPERITVAPGQVRNLQVAVRTPSDVQPGARYGQVLLRALPETDGNEPMLETDVAVPVHTIVGKDLRIEGVLSPVELLPSPDGLQMTVGVRFTNTGQIHVLPAGEVVLERQQTPVAADGAEYVGEPVWVPMTRLPMPATETPVLPGGTRLMGTMMAIPTEPGQYRASVLVRVTGGAPLSVQRTFRVADGVLQPDDP